MHFLLKVGVFHCYVSLPEGKRVKIPMIIEVPSQSAGLLPIWWETSSPARSWCRTFATGGGLSKETPSGWEVASWNNVPSWELTYPHPQGSFEDDLPFPVWCFFIPWRLSFWCLETFFFSRTVNCRFPSPHGLVILHLWVHPKRWCLPPSLNHDGSMGGTA